jgi:cation diffusion facilitator CzcD-associated flavoprotein CzcO
MLGVLSFRLSGLPFKLTTIRNLDQERRMIRASTTTDERRAKHFDVLIVGAGLSGIGAAHHLQERFPEKTYALLEARAEIGGTWDLFRYPGIRSDSDMQTLGYRFRPWTEAKAIADGPSILNYVRETAREAGIDRHIRFEHKVLRADWSNTESQWTINASRGPQAEPVTFTCGFFFVCGGYYNYDEGYTPKFDGIDDFQGQVVHPQFWPEDLDYTGKKVIVIGSGATAVTLVPALTDNAAHVTMLQRSPSYIVSVPAEDQLANRLRRVLGDRASYPITRWKNVGLTTLVYQLSRRRPKLVRKLIRAAQTRQLPEGYEIDKHFNPPYDPWDQRMCVVPDGDLFKALQDGKASIVTDRVETFTDTGIRLETGQQLAADIIVTATGLNLLAFGGVELAVDGTDVSLPDTLAYKGMMLSGVPNFAFTVGYTNASWTLKADLVAEYVCRLLAHMDQHGHTQCVPTNDDPTVETRPLLDFAAGYVQRSISAFPKNGSKAPWQLGMNYAADLISLRHRPVEDNAMRFTGRPMAIGRERPLAEVA